MLLAVEGEGDPLYWDHHLAAWVLAEVLPVDPLIPREALDQVPKVLPALVTWSHQVTEVDPGMTKMVQEAMSPLLADLSARWADPRMRVERSEALVDWALNDSDPAAFRLALLALQVGGAEALNELSTLPLPAEELELAAVPEDLVERVREIDSALLAGLEHVGEGKPELDEPVLGEEFLTACRRLLTQIMARDPDVLRRRASTRNTAAAVAWIVGRGNDLVGHSPAPIRTGDLMRAFGVKSTPSQRAETLMNAAVLPRPTFGAAMGDPDLLVSAAREAIIAERERLASP